MRALALAAGEVFVRRIFVVVSAAALLGACNAASTPGRGELFASDAEMVAKDDAICRGYGAEPGTPTYIQCRALQDQRRDNYKIARRLAN